MDRRSFLGRLATGLGLAVAAPAIVRAESLMPVRNIIAPVRFPVLPAYNVARDEWQFLPNGYLMTLSPEQVEAARLCDMDVVEYARNVARLIELKRMPLDRDPPHGLAPWMQYRWKPE